MKNSVFTKPRVQNLFLRLVASFCCCDGSKALVSSSWLFEVSPDGRTRTLYVSPKRFKPEYWTATETGPEIQNAKKNRKSLEGNKGRKSAKSHPGWRRLIRHVAYEAQQKQLLGSIIVSSVFRGTPAESDGLKGRADDTVSLPTTNQRYTGGEVASVPGSRARGEDRKWTGCLFVTGSEWGRASGLKCLKCLNRF